jgi:osmoprotectant transport system substrate-binding protein
MSAAVARRLATALLVPVLVVSVLPACARGERPVTAEELDGSITVASFNFAESALLGELYALALDDAGFPVDRQLRLGAREIVQPALQQGMVDLVPEYAGSALSFLSPEAPPVTDIRSARAVLGLAYERHGVEVLEPAAAENQNGFVVREETATSLGLRTLSDLARVAGSLAFGGPPECPARRLCLAGLRDVYGIEFRDVQRLDSGGPLTLAALYGGRVDVALIFTSSGALAGTDLVLLEDDRDLQPAENIVPMLRRAVVERHGEGVRRVVDAVTEQLDTAELVELNRRLDRGEAPADVAAGWLASNDLR